MPSDTPRLDATTAALVDDLRAVVPAAWAIRDVEAKVERALGVVLYYEIGDLVSEVASKPIPKNLIGVEYTLTLTAPEQDPQKGTATVIEAALNLLPALDRLRLIYWDRAEKMRLSTGETAYRLAITHLSRYTNPATAEPIEE